jgi:hypothetical protein
VAVVTETRIPRIEVPVATAPDPHRLRAAIAERLAGRPWAGPEAAVADAVRRAVEGSRRCS